MTSPWRALMVVVVITAIVFSNFWRDARDERNELSDQLALSTIVGHAYIDRGIRDALDDSDWPAEGLKIELYQIRAVWESVLVQEVLVDASGQYRFTIEEPGMYYVLPVPAIPGYPGWNWIVHLRPGNILVEKGKLYSGPIFLARENEGQG